MVTTTTTTTTTMQSAAGPKPQPAPPSRPMAHSGPDHRDPMEMTVVELEAAIAALPGERDALREAFDRLTACSPSPLPFAWEDLDGHISSLQSSIALRFRQLRVLEAAGAAPSAAALGGTRGDRKGENQEEEELEEEEEEEEEEMEEAVEVEVEEEVAVEVEEETAELEKKADEEIQEADSDKICNDGKEATEVEMEEEVEELEKADEDMQEANINKICTDEKDGKETREMEVKEEVAELEKKADDDMQEANYDKICNDEKDGMEASEEEEVEEEAKVMIGGEMKNEKEAREEEQASKLNQQDPDKDMQVVDKEELNTKDTFKAYQDKEEQDHDTNMDETAAKMVSSLQHKEEACDKNKEKKAQEQDVHDKVEGAKKTTDQEAVVASEVSSDRGNLALPGRSDDRTIASTDMDAQRLVKLICTNTEFNSEFHGAARRASDAAALVLHVVELFLHNKIFVKTNKVWASCVELVQMVPVVVTNPSADTIEQAKRVAKDWKEMIDNPKSCNVLGSLASWGLLYFLISYNIVTEFDTKEIFSLFGNISFKQMKKSAVLLKGLGLVNRIPELMDYLIGNGHEMDVLCLARIFNLVDKYPPFSLLKGYIEKAKQTAMEIAQKNTTHKFQRAVIIKEVHNLRRAHVLAKKEITNSNLCTSIREEINILLNELEKKKRSLADPLTASTSNSQQQQTKSKKRKKEQKQRHKHHKGQENQMRGQLSGLAEKLEKKQRKPQQEQQQTQEDKPEEKKHKQEDELEEKKQKQEENPEEKKQKPKDKPEEKKRKQEDKPEEKQQQNKQKHQKRPRQRTPKVPTQGYPAMWNAALRGHLEPPPYAAMHGAHHGYPAQPGWPGVHCASPFMPQFGAPEYIGPFTPFCPRPEFHPW